jgi:hypothetical protein
MEFAAGAAAGAAAAGAAAGALAAGFAAGAAAAGAAAGALEVVASAFLLFFDFFAAVAEVSVLAAVLSLAAILSAAAASFLLFFDFFVVVVVLSVVVVLVWAAANTGINARLNTKDKIAIHRVSLFREFLIFLFSSHVRGMMPRILRTAFLKPVLHKKVALEIQETLQRRSQWVNKK